MRKSLKGEFLTNGVSGKILIGSGNGIPGFYLWEFKVITPLADSTSTLRTFSYNREWNQNDFAGYFFEIVYLGNGQGFYMGPLHSSALWNTSFQGP